jgi:hypothetical protein
MRDRTVNVAEMVDNDTEDRFEDKLAEINQEVQQYNRNCSRTSGKAVACIESRVDKRMTF